MKQSVKLDEFSVMLTYKWTCPNCQHQNNSQCNVSPYRIIAENGTYDCCKKCDEGHDLTFYNED